MPIVVASIPSIPKLKPAAQIDDEFPLCSLCHKSIEEEDGIRCSKESCTMFSHMICLAQYFLHSNEEYIPIRGRCVECNTMILWGNLIKTRRTVWDEGGWRSERERETKVHIFKHETVLRKKSDIQRVYNHLRWNLSSVLLHGVSSKLSSAQITYIKQY